MNCRECQDLLERCLDERRMTASPAAHEHVRECDACRGNFAAAHALLAGLAQLTPLEPPVTMSANVAKAVLAERRRRRRWASFGGYAAAGLAACLLLFFGVSWLTLREPQPIAKGPNVEPPRVETPQIAQRADDAQKAVASLTRSVAETTKSRIDVFLPDPAKIEAALPPWPEADEPLDPAAESLKQAGMSVAQTFEPVAHTAAQTAVRAFDFFAREMPVLDLSKN